MVSKIFIFYFCSLFKILDTCLPTQQVDSSLTTTTPTTTTTATEPPFPCTACPKVYNEGCLGPGFPNWCATAADLGITYGLGLLSLLPPPFNTYQVCSVVFTCPLGTSPRLDLFGLSAPTPSLVVAWCRETGADAGKWNYGIPPIAFPLKSLDCVGILSGG